MNSIFSGTKDYEIFLDNHVVIYLHDGRYMYGILRSFDQFNNITLEQTVCRIFIDDEYAERRLGLHVIRGENIILIGVSQIKLRDLVKREYEYVENKLSETIRNEKL
ncbi:Small Nuclear ribonucleoprotein splicing factor [Trachipleistophora hominis]|uniref:Small Nuclear ribonucleoprotein splicing factor n=1 Tax=Trachipleistophora hominis TaxID=72359 RepID=L7JVR2_TRAHO|nr:Small Nuclear ribonucleoprotein splicing factor [Trachipleistophora hominis]